MRCAFLLMVVILLRPSLHGQELDVERLFEDRNLVPVTELLDHGEYDLVSRIAEAAIQRGLKAPEWRMLRLRALMRLGREEEAQEEAQLAVKTFPGNLELLMLQHDQALRIGRADLAQAALKAINLAARDQATKDRSAAEWVALGRAALALGADAKKVISQYFQVAQSKDPKLESAYLAEGHLALAKNDAKRAAEVFRAGLKAHGETAALRTGLALAFAESDRAKQEENLIRALELNPQHAEALLSQAELLIGAEKFLEAEAAIQKVLAVSEHHPEAWALRAAVAQLSGAEAGKVLAARQQGRQRWSQNPQVDHVLGRVLSRAYRFAEGAAYQRQALALDPAYLPAKVQLCHDLLRLGEEAEAWKLAATVRESDGYHVQAHNIGLLEQQMRGYTTQSFADFILKMPKRDWPIYGEQALALLREAKATLTAKYGLNMQRPVMVEFFGEQQDFAIRTFGSLGGQGLLGVCFGTVITMNSPGGLAHGRNNWESTLWHEFCHVITLTLTQNKMPRWLSEGISVYEESLRSPAWGMAMNPQFRRMILEEEASTPVGQLSSAFMNPPSSEHLLFAYFQSSQVVAYLVETYGLEKLRGVLEDLAQGRRINEALEAHTTALGRLEKDFSKHLQRQAEAYGAKADWTQAEADEIHLADPDALAAFLRKHPHHLQALHQHCDALTEEENWPTLLAMAERLIDLVPEDCGADSGYQRKALALRKLQREEEELAVLRHIAERDSSAMPVFLRLIEHETSKQNWTQVQLQASRALSLNPFLRTPQQALAESAEALGQKPEAIAAHRRVLLLDPTTSAMTHYRLAKLLRDSDALGAKKHLLEALILAPRFREGHALLRDWR